MLPVRMNRNGGLMLDNTIDAFRRELDRLLDAGQDVTNTGSGDRQISYPVDVHEDADHIYVEAELPGFTKDQVDVTIEHGTLTITAERKATSDTDTPSGKNANADAGKSPRTTHLHERRYTRVHRRFSLPETVDENNVEASLKDGLLQLTLHKKAEIKPRKIEVR